MERTRDRRHPVLQRLADALERRQRRCRQARLNLMLGARQDGKKGEIGPEVVGGRERGEAPGAVEEERGRIGEDSEGRLRFLAQNGSRLQAGCIRHETSNRGSTLTSSGYSAAVTRGRSISPLSISLRSHLR